MDALQLWRAEVAAGFRGQRSDASSTWRLDALWRAACAVAFARDAESLGLARTAELWRRHSSEIIESAARAAAAHRQDTAVHPPAANVGR